MRKRSSLVKIGRLDAGAGLLLGYVRVSRGADQTNAMRVKSLSSAGCRRIFEEVSPGGRWDRPELHRLLADLHRGDTVVVWKLDQLSQTPNTGIEKRQQQQAQVLIVVKITVGVLFNLMQFIQSCTQRPKELNSA